MIFRTLLSFLLVAAVVEAKVAPSLKAGSALGKKLMQKARRMENEIDMSWVPDYSIKFQKCHSLMQVAGEEGGGENEQGTIYTQHLVEFALCPSDSCTTGLGCKNGAKYILNMREFVEVYMEAKREMLEQECESVRENCNMNYCNDDEACQNQCFIDAGLEECIEEEGQEEEDMDRYMECDVLENNNNNNNNGNYNYNYNNGDVYYGDYFIGPYCSQNGNSIHLGVFLDQGCTVKAEDGVYEARTYSKLPYSDTSMIDMDCISCEKVDEDNNNNNNNGNNNNNNNGNYNNGNYNNNNNNNYNYKEVNEMCEQLYQQAGKCETNLGISYPITSACTYINDILPRLEAASKSLGVYTGGAGGRAAVAFAWLFGILAVALGAYSFLLYRRLRRSKVALNDASSDATMA